MNELVSNKRTATLLIVALVVLILGAIYYYVIYPLQNERDAKKNNVQVLQTEVAVLNEQYQSAQAEGSSTENTFQLVKQIPLTRELDELIRSMEEIELVSDSRIETVEFNNYDENVAESTLVPEETEPTDVTEEIESPEDAVEGEEVAPVSPIAETILPTNLKLITFNVSIQAKSYEHFTTFVEEVEKIDRIMRIDQVNMAAPGEQEIVDKSEEEATAATIQITTFYYDEQK